MGAIQISLTSAAFSQTSDLKTVNARIAELLKEKIEVYDKLTKTGQEKNYMKAIELYKKAIAIDQIAYPAGYSNVALLFAQINNFNAAINNMKKYLLLEPEASDARSAQDKIYEW